MSNPLKNVSLRDCRKFLEHKKCKLIRTHGGHEIWARADLARPVIIQSHIDPVPKFIMRQIVKSLNVTKEQFHEIIKSI